MALGSFDRSLDFLTKARYERQKTADGFKRGVAARSRDPFSSWTKWQEESKSKNPLVRSPQSKQSMQKTFDNYMRPINEFDRMQYILP